ncbi:hypothetical protein ACVGVM_24270 [Pseudonocardia bannensis]|uniref:Uncharacterized protein n=1 Tax=Pseudonocardia bannensis TaxID=630973 RepID=A0A848DG07_9PSEU|nr:hypothetical protein [Pseudonocardia bannensis]NMH91567.1 hypothetical protein [Pseudonocardia bannensis]
MSGDDESSCIEVQEDDQGIGARRPPPPGVDVRARADLVLEHVQRVVAVAVEPVELLTEAGGLLRRLALCGTAVEILLATDGTVDGRAVTRMYSRIGLPDTPRHRLGLRRLRPSPAGDDVLAALSEIIGFDPEPGLAILAPAALPGRIDRTMLSRIARLAAEIYRADLVRHLPIDDVARPWTVTCPLTAEEARRKRYALGRPVTADEERFVVERAIPAQRTVS